MHVCRAFSEIAFSGNSHKARIGAFRENSYKAQIVALSENLQIDALSRKALRFMGMCGGI